MTEQCGIYAITNRITGDYYIGSSNNIRARLNQHRRHLANNKHYNHYLQRAWNKYSADNFEFTVLLFCDVEYKLFLEQCLLDLFKPTYNTAKDAKAPMQGLHHSEESKRKIGEASKGKSKGNSNRIGHKHTEETKRKISETKKGKPSNRLGKHCTEETRKRMSEAHIGKQAGALHPMFGKQYSDEAKKMMSESQLRRRLRERGGLLREEL